MIERSRNQYENILKVQLIMHTNKSKVSYCGFQFLTCIETIDSFYINK